MKKFSYSILICFVFAGQVALTSCNSKSANSNPGTSFIVLGDWGNYGSKKQRSVADQMNKWAANHPVDFIISTGDNIYSKGVSSISDSLWQLAYEDVYTGDHIKALPWYAVLGNHDYQGNYQAQIDYSQINGKWYLPATYYNLTREGEAGTIEFFFLDTNPFKAGYHENPEKYIGIADQDTSAQKVWFTQQLEASKTDWKIVVGHHPIYSAGRYGDAQNFIDWLTPIFEKHQVQVYFNGHEHDMQHLKPPGKTHYVISGSGSKTRETGKGPYTRFSGSRLGFVYVRLTSKEMLIQYVDNAGEVLHEASVKK
ncbi:MAG: metallophosphoesterase [Cyclobacteriaceae bacterium]|nr:metallophosphoesterase [Cyclobacteriaceae bacterium HetDA_MAG_MS6]